MATYTVFDGPAVWVDLVEQDRAYQELQKSLLMAYQLAQIYEQLPPGQSVEVRMEGLNTEEHGSWMERSPLLKPPSSPHISEVQNSHSTPLREPLHPPGSPGMRVLTLHRPAFVCKGTQFVNTSFRVDDGSGRILVFNLDRSRLGANEKPMPAQSGTNVRFIRPGAQEQRAQLEQVAKKEIAAQRESSERKNIEERAKREQEQREARQIEHDRDAKQRQDDLHDLRNMKGQWDLDKKEQKQGGVINKLR